MVAATRTLMDGVSNPSGFSGPAFSSKARAEVEGLWGSIVNTVGSIAGTANAVTGVCSPVLIGSYANGQTFRWIPTANNTTAVTVNFDGKGAVAWKQPDGTALSANDVVSGVPEEGWYDSAAGYFRKSRFSDQSLAASTLVSITSSLLWVLLGDTTIGSAVAQVEHTFTASAYSKIQQQISGIAPSGSNVNFTATLRNASGAIVSLTPSSIFSVRNESSGDNVTMQIDYLLNVITAGAKMSHYGKLFGVGYDSVGSVPAVIGTAEAVGANATAPDRVRIVYASGNIAAGRLMTYGLIK